MTEYRDFMKGARRNKPYALLQKYHMPLPNKLNNFLILFFFFVSVPQKAIILNHQEGHVVFSAPACKAWCLSMLLKLIHVGFFPCPHHHLSLSAPSQSSTALWLLQMSARQSCRVGNASGSTHTVFLQGIFASARSDLPVQFTTFLHKIGLAQRKEWQE